MSIKSFFNKNKTQEVAFKNSTQKNISNFGDNLESDNYVKELNKKNQNYLPDVDYSDPTKFARFGLARKYYEGFVTKVTDYYPYDGSKYEQLKFENELNPLERYIYNFEYPKSTGYVNFAPNGWGTQASTNSIGIGLPNTVEYVSFYNQSKNNVYDPANNRRENTRFIFLSGSTVEFWLKKNAYPDAATQTTRECVFYMASTGSTNKDKALAIILPNDYGNYRNEIWVNYYTNQTTTPSNQIEFHFDTGLATIADSTWHHYAFTFYSSSVGNAIDFYRDGIYKSTQQDVGIVDFTGSAFCTLGAFGGFFNVATPIGSGKLSGSIDEFRFWNVKRSAKEIGLNYFKNVGGGANTDDANVNLGVYFKFNEGILGKSSTDSIILDYSGHVCNGTFTGYSSTSSRNTSSAITLATENVEVGTPIIYYDSPLVQTFLTNKLLLADSHDYSNTYNLKSLMPSWIIEDDYNNGETLTNFLQVLAGYLDVVYLQTEKFKDIKNKTYLQYSGSESNFSNLLLSSNGFEVPSVFLNFEELNAVASQNNKKEYTVVINDLKNIVYKNIYNNLDIIYKSKGTEKSFKNLIKCFGVDEDIYKLNVYSDGTTYQLNDTYLNKSIKKDVIEQNNYRYNNNANSVFYTYYNPTDTNTTSFITASNATSGAICFENNFYFSTKPQNKFVSPNEASTLKTFSLFGTRGATNSNSSTTPPTVDSASFSVRYNEKNDKAYFQLFSSKYSINLTSSYFDNFYDNNLWNVSFQVYQNKFLTTPEYLVKFSGYSFLSDNNFRSFELTSSIINASGSSFFNSNKRLYVGADRTNITGAINYISNHKVASTRVWMDKLDSDELKEHAKNPNNFGRKNPIRNSTIDNTTYIPKSETLILHWDYSTITSSDSNGNILYVNDLTSGSISNLYSTSYLSGSKQKIYTGVGYGFEPSTTIKSKELIYGQEQQDPESIISSNLVNILQTNDDYYTKQARPEKFFFAVETSMYDIISRNALNFFGSIIEFNNLIADGASEYRFQYKDLDFFRRVFFSKVQNTIDLDKYVSVYKWIDDALDGMLANLLPASANSSDKARTVIENHILQRNKVKKQIYPKSFISYVYDPNTGAIGDEFLYVGKKPKNNGAGNKQGIAFGGTPMKK